MRGPILGEGYKTSSTSSVISIPEQLDGLAILGSRATSYYVKKLAYPRQDLVVMSNHGPPFSVVSEHSS